MDEQRFVTAKKEYVDLLYTSKLFRFINSLSCARRSEVSTVSISIEKRTAVLANVLLNEDLFGAKTRKGDDKAVRCKKGEARHKKSMGVTWESNLEDKTCGGATEKATSWWGCCSWSRAGCWVDSWRKVAAPRLAACASVAWNQRTQQHLLNEYFYKVFVRV